MEHPEWMGFSAWDMIMPLFLFVVGVAMPFSLGRRLEEGAPRSRIYAKAFRRVLVLWILGMIAQGNLLKFDLTKLKLYSNTLQAIAAGYLIATVALLQLRRPRDRAAVAGGLLVLYWLIMSFLPAPGFSIGSFLPGPDGGDRYQQNHNLALWIDKGLLGHFQDGTHYTWILSSISFGATVLMGVLAGEWLRGPVGPWKKVAGLVGAGIGCLAVGWIWQYTMPIIKHIWTSSMALWAGGWSLLLLAFFYMVLDVLGFKKWAYPFIVIGSNAIVAYMAQSLFDVAGIGRRIFGGFCALLPAGAGQFLLVLLTFSLLWTALWYLYRNRTFVRI
jgi:predicted acyltransferase